MTKRGEISHTHNGSVVRHVRVTTPIKSRVAVVNRRKPKPKTNRLSKNLDQTAWVVANRTINASTVAGKRVLIRCDYNVPIKNGTITDDTRIVASLETLRFCIDNGAKQLILVSHLGRPKEKNKEDSLAPVATRLSQSLGQSVVLAPSCLYSEFMSTMPPSQRTNKIVLLENVRFHSQEEKNDSEFARQMAQFADVYVNDAFGTAHRGHASNSAITAFLPSYIGLLMRVELAKLGLVTHNPKRPLIVLLGFAKISDKLETLIHLLQHADTVLLGGAVAFTFLAAQRKEIGKSKVEADKISLAADLLRKFGRKIVLPLDVVCATDLESAARHTFDVDHIPADMAGFDIGPKTIELFGRYLEGAKTVFWNGPMGVFEHPPYDKGTNDLALWLAEVTKENGVISIIGGGDTASAAAHAKVANLLTHVSTGGGASLEFMEGKTLPAIKAIYSSIVSKKKK